MFIRFCLQNVSVQVPSLKIKHVGCLFLPSYTPPIPASPEIGVMKQGHFPSAGLPIGTVNTSEQCGNEITKASGTAGCLMHLQRLTPAVKAGKTLTFKFLVL